MRRPRRGKRSKTTTTTTFSKYDELWHNRRTIRKRKKLNVHSSSSDEDGWKKNVVDEEVFGKYSSPNTKTTQRSRIMHMSRLDPIIRSGNIQKKLEESSRRNVTVTVPDPVGVGVEKSHTKTKTKKTTTTTTTTKKKKKRRRRKKKVVKEVLSPKNMNEIIAGGKKLMIDEETNHPQIPHHMFMEPYYLIRNGEKVMMPGRKRKAGPHRIRKRKKLTVREVDPPRIRKRKKLTVREVVPPRIRKRKKLTVKEVDPPRSISELSRKIAQYNESVNEINKRLDETERSNEILVQESMSLLKATSRDTPIMNVGGVINMSESHQNLTSELFSAASQLGLGTARAENPANSAREHLRLIESVRMKKIMDAHSKHYGRNHDPTNGYPEMIDRTMMDERMGILSDDISQFYTRMNPKNYPHQMKGIIMPHSQMNITRAAMNEVVESAKRGFQNDTYKEGVMLTVEEVNEAMSAFDPTKQIDGRTFQPACLNAMQTTESDMRFMFNSENNTCQLNKATNGRITGWSWPTSGKYGEIQTFESRNICWSCLMVEQNGSQLDNECLARPATTISQSVTVYCNIPVVNRTQHSFNKRALMPKGKHFRGSPAPALMWDMSNFFYTPNAKIKYDGSGWLGGLKVDKNVVFTPDIIPDPGSENTAPPIDPRVRFSVSTNVEEPMTILSDHLQILKTTDEDENAMVIDEGTLHQTSYAPNEISFLRTLMDRETFIKSSKRDENIIKELHKYYDTNLKDASIVVIDEMNVAMEKTFGSFSSFMNMPMDELVYVHDNKFSFVMWNPFIGVGHCPVKRFPYMALYILRVNMFYHVAVFLQIDLEKGNNYTILFKNDKKKSKYKKKDEDVVHSSNRVDDITVQNLRTSHDHKKYYILKRITRFLESNITSMIVFESIVKRCQIEGFEGQWSTILNSPTLYQLIISRWIRYDYSPYDMKYMKVSYDKYVRDTDVQYVMKEIRMNQDLCYLVCGLRVDILLSMELVDLGEYLIQSLYSDTDEVLDTWKFGRLVDACVHFFPVRKLEDLVLLGKVERGTDLSLTAWNEMVLIQERGEDEMNTDVDYRGVSLFNPRDHGIYWAWLLRINVLQKMMEDVSNYSCEYSEKMMNVVTDVMKSGGTMDACDEMDEMSMVENCVSFEKIAKLRTGLEELVVPTGMWKKDAMHRKFMYKIYVILHDHSVIGSHMILKQIFDNERILGVPRDGYLKPTGFYDKTRPSLPDLTLCGESIPNIGPFLAMHHMNFKSRNDRVNPVDYTQNKVFPNLCQIRKISSMILNQWKTDEHARSYLLWIVWCTIMGMYEHAHHPEIGMHYPRILKSHIYFFSDTQLDGMCLKERREAIFMNVASHKFKIHDVLRENCYNVLSKYQPVVLRYRKKVWRGAPYIDYSMFAAACVQNPNMMREFYAKFDLLPKDPEVLSPSMKSRARKKLTSQHVNANLKLWRKKNYPLYVAYRWMLIHLNKWASLEDGLFYVIKNILSDEDWPLKSAKRGRRSGTPKELRGLSKESVKILTDEFIYIFNKHPRTFLWMYFLFLKKTRLEDNLVYTVNEWVSKLGVKHAVYLLWKKCNSMVVRKSANGQVRRVAPLLHAGIYRLYDSSYVKMMLDTFKNMSEERIFVSIVSGRKTPQYVTMEFEDNAVMEKIRNFPLLGYLTRNYRKYYERVFRFLHDDCGISLVSLYLLMETIVFYTKKKSENKIGYKLRSMSPRDYQLLRTYFMEDFSKKKVEPIKDVVTNILDLHYILERNSKRWMNVCSSSSRVFEQRHGFDFDSVGSYPRGSPLDHYMTYTQCCGRLVRFSYYKGHGNYRAVSKMRVTEGSWMDDQVDKAMCRCHLFSGNVVDCPIHRNALGQRGETVCDNLSCRMFKKNDKKKKNHRKLNLLSELMSLLNEVSSLKRRGDVSIIDARGRHAKIYNIEDTRVLEKTGRIVNHRRGHSPFLDSYRSKNIFGEQKSEGMQYVEDGEEMMIDDIIERIKNGTQKMIEREGVKSITDVDMVDVLDRQDGEGDENDENDEDEVDVGMDMNVDVEEEEEEEGDVEVKGKKDVAETTYFDKDYGTYITYDSYIPPMSMDPPTEDGRGEGGDGDDEIDDIIVTKKRKLRGIRTSESVYKISLGNGLADRISRWTKKYCKFQCSYKCGNPNKTNILSVKILGNHLVVMSSNESVFVNTWCSFCGSFVRQNESLYYGNKYMCESCWMKRPESCFYFYDQLTEETEFVEMQKAVDHLTEWMDDLQTLWMRSIKCKVKTLKGDVADTMYDDESENFTHSRKEPKKIDPWTGKKTRVTAVIADDVFFDKDETDHQRDGNVDSKKQTDVQKIALATIKKGKKDPADTEKKKKKKKVERCPAYAISICRAMRRNIRLHVMESFRVWDNTSVNPVVVIQTARKYANRRIGYFKKRRDIHEMDTLKRVFNAHRRFKMEAKIGTNVGLWNKYSKW